VKLLMQVKRKEKDCEMKSVRCVSVLRYWAAGMVFVIVAWISMIPLLFLQGLFEFLTLEYGSFASPLVYILVYIIIVPYVMGRIVSWVSHKLFQKP
jgi:hypothetical protein